MPQAKTPKRRPEGRLFATPEIPTSVADPASSAGQLALFASLTDLALESLPERLRTRIAVDPATGCWEWHGRRDADGYGRFGSRGAHRVIFELACGPVPAGLQLDHVCRHRPCVNPDHLEPVTARENTRRGESFAGVNSRKVRCDHGHAYSEENTYRWRGRRDCRACIRRRVAEYAARKRGANLGLAA